MLVCAACGRVRFDPLTGNDAPTDGSLDVDGSLASCASMPACPGATIPLVVGGTASAGTTTADRGYAGSCGGVANPEAVWKLDPLASGTFTITVAAGGPGLIVVRDACCTGPELACAFSQPVTITRMQGQAAFLIVEALSANVSVDIVGS